jgi:hypothetical protein
MKKQDPNEPVKILSFPEFARMKGLPQTRQCARQYAAWITNNLPCNGGLSLTTPA